MFYQQRTRDSHENFGGVLERKRKTLSESNNSMRRRRNAQARSSGYRLKGPPRATRGKPRLIVKVDE